MNIKRITEELERIGKDSDWLAEQVGVSRSTMRQNYMRGLMPSKAVALSISRVLKCDLKNFLHKEEIERLGFSLAEEKAS